jgi:nitrate reductase cytochrome c-type subunit
VGLNPAGQPASNNTGVASNCMSCHARANYNPNRVAGAPQYSGDRYVDLADPQFAGTLQLDFLWSLPSNAQ